MPTAARLNDKGTQHDGYHETVITAGSPTVSVNGLPAARMGDPLTPHSKPEHPPHPRKIAGGSATVFIDGLPAARSYRQRYSQHRLIYADIKGKKLYH